MLTVFRNTGHQHKVKFSPDALLYLRAVFLILAKEAEVGAVGAMNEFERTKGQRGELTAAHFRDQLRALTYLEYRCRYSFPKKLFLSAIDALIEADAEGKKAG